MEGDDFIKIKLEFEVENGAHMLDITSLLYDFELLYDFIVLSILADYKEYRFTQYFWYRYGRPLEDVDKLRAVEIVKRSSMIVVIGIGAYVASMILLPLVTLAEKISNWKLNRQKLKLEVEKLQLDVKAAEIQRATTLMTQHMFEIKEDKAWAEAERARIELDKAQLELEQMRIQNSILRRLERNPIKLNNMSVLTVESKYAGDEDKEVTEFEQENNK